MAFIFLTCFDFAISFFFHIFASLKKNNKLIITWQKRQKKVR